MKELRFNIEGKEVRGFAEYLGGQLWVHVDGESFLLPAESGVRKRGAKGPTMNDGNLVAPMPGKITKVLKKSGEPVRAGEVVLVMEAMKMEYSIEAPHAGQIAKLECQPGDQVGLNQLLCEINKSEGLK